MASIVSSAAASGSASGERLEEDRLPPSSAPPPKKPKIGDEVQDKSMNLGYVYPDDDIEEWEPERVSDEDMERYRKQVKESGGYDVDYIPRGLSNLLISPVLNLETSYDIWAGLAKIAVVTTTRTRRSDIIEGGRWFMRFPSLQPYWHDILGIHISDTTDFWIWDGNSAQRHLDLSKAWHVARKKFPSFQFYNILWFPHHCPKMVHCLFKAVMNRLPTRERLSRFGIIQDASCTLCHLSIETTNHLFFDCSYTKYIWSLCKLKLGLVTHIGSLHEEMQTLQDEKLVFLKLLKVNKEFGAFFAYLTFEVKDNAAVCQAKIYQAKVGYGPGYNMVKEFRQKPSQPTPSQKT